MFRILLLSYLVLTVVFAENIQKEEANTQVSFTQVEFNSYKKAMAAFKEKDYQTTYDILSELYLNHLSDTKINFYLGRSAFELKKYNQSYAAYQRVLIQEEDNKRVRLEVGRVLYVLKSYNEALKEFEYVLKYPIPTQVRNNVQSLIASIEQKKKKYFINGAVQFGLGNNDNVNSTTHLPYTTYGNTTLNNDTNKVEDTFNKMVLVLNLVVPFEKNKQFAYEASFIGYSQDYFDANSSDLGLMALSNGISYIQNKYKLSLNLYTDKIWYGSDPLMTNIGLNPKITYLFSKDLMLDVSYKYSKKRMTKSADLDKDAVIKNFTFNITKKLPAKTSVSLSSYLSTERKVRGIRSDVDKNKKGYKLSFSWEFLPTLNTVVSYGRDSTFYKQADPNFPNRDDKSDNFSISFSKTLDKTSNISVDYTQTKNTSNIEANTYEQNSMGITYTKTF